MLITLEARAAAQVGPRVKAALATVQTWIDAFLLIPIDGAGACSTNLDVMLTRSLSHGDEPPLRLIVNEPENASGVAA